MSYDVTIYYRDTDAELFWRNHTSNTAQMWKQAGVDLRDFDGKPASELILPLSQAIITMERDEPHYRSMDAKNGWGNFDTTVDFLEAVLRACMTFPDEKLSVSA